jgi:hypothetical protein
MWRRLGIIAFVAFGLALLAQDLAEHPRAFLLWSFPLSLAGELLFELLIELIKYIWGAPTVPAVHRLALPPIHRGPPATAATARPRWS